MPIALGVIPDSTATHTAADWYAGVIAPISDSVMALEGDGALNSPLPTWTPLTLAGAWVFYGTAQFAVPAVRKNGDFVQCKGLIKNGAAGTLFTLPVGYRPSFQQQFAANCGGFNVATIQAATSGVVTLISLGGGNNTYLSLDHIIFDLGA